MLLVVKGEFNAMLYYGMPILFILTVIPHGSALVEIIVVVAKK